MEFIIETWPVSRLMETLDNEHLNLNPPYQRNPIWPKATQKFLINSIKEGQPIPNLFLYRKENGLYDMVDGQQRTRALRLYQTTDEINFLENDNEFKNGLFLQFQISIIIITRIEPDEFIEDFYYMVNSSGIKLNRPESLKAKFFDKRFLTLVEELTISPSFTNLNLIPASSQKRMLDRDLVEELCTLILFGITDKKNQVNRIYETDIDEDQSESCRITFLQILDKINLFDQIKPIKSTRYRQRNDLYTLFNIIKDNLNVDDDSWAYLYNTLLVLEAGIRPSRNACPVLSEYAFNCVSQSNSSNARRIRFDIMNDLLLNQSTEANEKQLQVQAFYPAQGDYFRNVNDFLTFNNDVLAEGFELKGQID